MNNNINEQTKNAFDFVEKLYYEISYLIKEIQGILELEEERFIIIRPSGYGVTVRTSTGLETQNVAQWLTKNFTVFFCSEEFTALNKGQTNTKFDENLKVLVVHIDIVAKDIEQPRIVFGTIKDIKTKKEHKKIEKLLWEFAYNDEKIFGKWLDPKYEDSQCSFNRYFKFDNLYAISDNSDILEKVIKPMLKQYREFMNNNS